MKVDSIKKQDSSYNGFIFALSPKIALKQTNEQKNTIYSEKKQPLKIASGFAALLAIISGTAYYVRKRNNIKLANEIIIQGSSKFKNLLRNLAPEDYDSSKVFKANFHIHSKCSDGKLSPIEILEQANAIASKLQKNEKFCFAITDHDNIDGLIEVINAIKKNPKKYSKLRFIPGVEMSVKHIDNNIFSSPVELDFLIYGFDVNNPKLRETLLKRKTTLLEQTKKLFEEINIQCANNENSLSVDKMQQEAADLHLRYIGSNGYLKALKNYIKVKSSNVTEEVLNALAKKHFGNKNYAFSANIDLESAVNLAKDINAISILAHPGKFNFTDAGLKTSGTSGAENIVKTFTKVGGSGIEYYYQSYKAGNLGWWEKIKNTINSMNLDLLKSGGYDTHSADIAKH